VGGACSIHTKIKSAYKILNRKSNGKRPLEISSHRWNDSIKINLTYMVGRCGMFGKIFSTNWD
jgi:hypothetical protein